VIEHINNGYLDEESFFAIIREETKNFKKTEKIYILNSIIYVAYIDKKISDKEKESILQVASLLQFDTNYKKILAEYNKSEFGKSLSKFYITAVIVIFAAIVSVSGIFIIRNQMDMSNKINNYEKKYVVFSEVFFNRYVIYKNVFAIGDGYFEKQAVFYLAGSAEIAFNPKYSSLTYNPTNHIVTCSYHRNFPFDLIQNFTSEVLVDEIKPKNISEEDAKNLGFVVGIVSGIGGAYLGGKASALISPFLPANLRPLSSLAGGVLGGVSGSAIGYFVTSNILEGVKITSDIAQKEKEAVVYAGKKLLLATLKADKNMISIYKEQFVKYIKRKYAKNGIEVAKVEFEQRDKNEATKN